MRPLAALVLVLAATGCAHARSPEQVLADIDTARYQLPTDTGEPYALAQHRGHEQVVMFFATWCVPCLAEVNQLQKLAARQDGLEIVGVVMDLDAARTAAAFRHTTGVTYPLLIADDATRAGESVFGRIPELPTTVVIDKQGVVRSAYTGLVPDEDLDKLIRAAR
ncbi:MAG: TlpA family protein disulfide reductase [Deltaproteobacteria bacterium]|nr:TlpA family protein disulfide reductase [Deltaproteobacteria bacterium]